MYLNHLGLPVSSEEIAESNFSRKAKGTYQELMLSYSRSLGLVTVKVNNYTDLFKEIDAGNPVIVFQNLGFDWYPLWHYSIIFGYDLKKMTLTMHSADEESKTQEIKKFDNSWKRGKNWAFVITAPRKLTPTTNETEYLKSASAFEQLNLNEPAKEAYLTMLTQWPQSYYAHFGLGNVYFSEKKFVQAQKSFEQSVLISPSFYMAWTNLAVVYHNLGLLEKFKFAKKNALTHAPLNIQTEISQKLNM